MKNYVLIYPLPTLPFPWRFDEISRDETNWEALVDLDNLPPREPRGGLGILGFGSQILAGSGDRVIEHFARAGHVTAADAWDALFHSLNFRSRELEEWRRETRSQGHDHLRGVSYILTLGEVYVVYREHHLVRSRWGGRSCLRRNRPDQLIASINGDEAHEWGPSYHLVRTCLKVPTRFDFEIEDK